MSLYAIILAAGLGLRAKGKKPKSLMKVNGKEVYKYSLETFGSIKQFKRIVLVVPQTFKNKLKSIKVVNGGKTRNESFERGMKALGQLEKNDKIFVHDAARMFLLKQDLIKLIKSKNKQGTLCYKNVKSSLGKSDLMYKNYHIQTPQFCTYEIYKKAKKNTKGKDLFTYLNLKHKSSDFIISSNKHLNFKITYPNDLKIAELLVK